jgi:endogenous inhibitor of DNA gyrase (YacG/DUF329 family)
MASWLLHCPECRKEFRHSPIPSRTLTDLFFPMKPDFPKGGLQIKCPNCMKASTFQRHDLKYSAA